MSSLYITAARVYQQSFQTHPHTTLAFTGGTLNGIGDAVAQTAQNAVLKRSDGRDVQPYDYTRTFRFFCYGFAISPVLGRWNAFLEHRFPLRSLTSPKRINGNALLKRVLCDQLIVAPIGLALFFASMGVMENRTAPQIVEKFQDLYKPALVTNWQVWPAAQYINFRFMPLAYRVPFQSSCGVFWTLYLSTINSKEDEKQDHRPS